ncbi:DoxX family membrane protein [Nocardia sp. NBC_01503]|uniref:MauE/DoxX family redox-associated membrane protein n=1 Tax=Nocardia sp. NBC_01503 TaxID=2975997 RepID=UPI002E7BB0A5|nr:MauE/DoxX family redox-associated membrane protein [Nocardia sp. NBC_01503]WTL32133.1 DoxX family membrane protein [Nocardia sp. NBC_01503]
MQGDAVVAVGVLAVRLVLAAVLVTAGLAKLGRGVDLRADIERYHLVPVRVLPFAAFLLPALELVLGTALLLNRATPVAAMVATAMFAAFTTGIVVNLRRGRAINCGCHGVLGDITLSWPLATRSLALTICAAVLAGTAAAGTVAVSTADTIATVVAVLLGLCATRLAALSYALNRSHHRLADLISATPSGRR